MEGEQDPPKTSRKTIGKPEIMILTQALPLDRHPRNYAPILRYAPIGRNCAMDNPKLMPILLDRVSGVTAPPLDLNRQ
jgi:hypothetical protein